MLSTDRRRSPAEMVAPAITEEVAGERQKRHGNRRAARTTRGPATAAMQRRTARAREAGVPVCFDDEKAGQRPAPLNR